jgi:hypothetical protein
VKSLPVFVSLVSLVFAVDGLAQTPAQGPIQLAQAGGASQGALPAASSGAGATVVSVVAAGVAAVAAVATSNTTTTAATH